MFEILRNLLFGAAIAAPIGPVSLEVIRRGIQGGFKAAISVATGAFIADMLYLTLFTFGLAGFVSDSVIKPVLWGFGACVLIALGLFSIRDYKKDNLGSDPVPTRNSLIAGFAVTMSSPITFFWWLAIASTLIGPTTVAGSYLKLLAIPIGAFLWFVLLSTLLSAGVRFLSKSVQRKLSLAAGVVLMCFGAYFLFNAFFG